MRTYVLLFLSWYFIGFVGAGLSGCSRNLEPSAPSDKRTTTQQMPKKTGLCDESDKYVALNGSPSAIGTFDSPWDIVTGLTSVSEVKAGHSLCIRGGTYRSADRLPGAKGFSIHLKGAPGAPITVKPFDTEHVIIDGGLQTYDTDPSEYVVITGLEVLVSENLTQPRVSLISGSAPPADLARPWGGINIRTGFNIQLINNTVHDNMQGIDLLGPVGGNSLAYGNIIYRNGWIGPDRHHGVGIYTQNHTVEWKYIQDGILFDNYSLNFEASGSPADSVDRYDVSNNIYYGGPNTDDGGFQLGGEKPSQTLRVFNNMGVDGDFRVGTIDGGDDAIVHGNKIWADLSFKFFTHFAASDNFAWKTDWPKPQIDGIEVAVPQGNVVVFKKNLYDSTRSNLAIVNFAGTSSQMIELDPRLPLGQPYTLLHPADLSGEPAFQGTYTGRLVEIPISGKLNVYVFILK